MEDLLKALYLVVGILFASIIQLLILSGVESHSALGSDIGSLTVTLSAVCAILLLIAILRNSKPGRLWHLLLVIPATFGLAAVVPVRGALALWQLPIAGALFALMIAYPEHRKADKDHFRWFLSLRQWGLAGVFTSIILGIGILASFNHGSEAHLLVRSLVAALTVMTLWTATIILVQRQWRIEDIRIALLRLHAIALMLLAVLLMAYQPQLSQNSVYYDAYLHLLPGAAATGLFLIATFFPRSIFGQAAIIATATIWAVVVSRNHGLAYLPTLSVMALLPLIVRFQNLALAFFYWSLIIAILVAGFGISEPIMITHGLSATLIFAATNWLVRSLEAFSDKADLKVDLETQALFDRNRPDRRSVIIGATAGVTILIFGGILLSAEFGRERTKAESNSQIIARVVASSIQENIREQELIATFLSQLPLETVTTQAEFNRITESLSALYPQTTMQWAPRGVIRFSNPLKGNEKTIGVNLFNVDGPAEGINHIVTTGERHWTEFIDDEKNQHHLLYIVPIFKPDTELSQKSLIGVAQVFLRTETLVSKHITLETERNNLRVWITNPSTKKGAVKPQLIFSSKDKPANYTQVSATASARGSPDADNEAIEIIVEVQPKMIDALNTLRARLQGLMILSILGATIIAFYAARQRRLEKEAQRINTRYLSIAAHSNEAMIISDAKGYIIDWNNAAEKIFGYTGAEAMGQNIDIIVPLDYLARHRAAFQRAVNSRNTKSDRNVSVELEALHKKGTIFPVQISVSSWTERDTKYFFAIISDISERKRAEKELLAREAQFRSLLMGATASLILSDKSGRITMVNDETCALFGYATDEMIGMNIDLLVPETLRAGHKALREEYFETGVATRLGAMRDLRAVRKDGKIIDFELGLSRIMIDDEEHVLASVIDISERKRAQMARSQFIANISHDLRTPLNAVLGYARMLQEAPLKGKYREQLKRLDQASGLLFSLVNDVLDWSKIEAGEIELANEPFNLMRSCDMLFSVMEGQAREKGLSFSWENRSNIPHYVCGDATRFHQIMYNLVGNAIKFTDYGDIAVAVSDLPSEKPHKVRLLFEVSDTGVGISEENLKHLFNRFKQVDQSATRRFQGSGLGLAIVKELAVLMDGNVKVTSELNVGSKFSVELEFDHCDEIPLEQDNLRKPDDGERLLGKHVLVVDDSDLLIELIGAILESAGAKVSSCTNGQEALDWLADNPDKVDIILMDVHMPVMDGITAVAIMRQEPALKGFPIVAMTAGATKTNIDEALNAGMTDCITKPFTDELLISTLLRNIRS